MLTDELDPDFRFGLTVRLKRDGRWKVTLPHQCGNWEITEEYDGSTRDMAVKRMTRLMREAQAAQAALMDGREYP